MNRGTLKIEASHTDEIRVSLTCRMMELSG